MKRLFIAVDLTDKVIDELQQLQEEFKAHIDPDIIRIRWTAPENMHLTLKFLGSTEDDLVEPISDVLDEVAAGVQPFEMSVRGIGAFPHPRHPRILWAGIDDVSAEALVDMHGHLEAELEDRFDVDRDEHNFTGHITFGRVKSSKTPKLTTFRGNLPHGPYGVTEVNEIVLYESHLSQSGAQYEALHHGELGG